MNHDQLMKLQNPKSTREMFSHDIGQTSIRVVGTSIVKFQNDVVCSHSSRWSGDERYIVAMKVKDRKFHEEASSI